jgi:hypothetical protein
MRGFGRSSTWAVAVFAGVSGLALLLPTQASAQFNIEGLIRGALQQQGCCYGGGGYHYRSGSGSSRHVKGHQNDQDSAPVDKTKEKDATQVESPNNGVSGRQTSAPAQSPARSVESDAPSKPTNTARGNDDQPAFSPSR